MKFRLHVVLVKLRLGVVGVEVRCSEDEVRVEKMTSG